MVTFKTLQDLLLSFSSELEDNLAFELIIHNHRRHRFSYRYRIKKRRILQGKIQKEAKLYSEQELYNLPFLTKDTDINITG